MPSSFLCHLIEVLWVFNIRAEFMITPRSWLDLQCHAYHRVRLSFRLHSQCCNKAQNWNEAGAHYVLATKILDTIMSIGPIWTPKKDVLYTEKKLMINVPYLKVRRANFCVHRNKRKERKQMMKLVTKDQAAKKCNNVANDKNCSMLLTTCMDHFNCRCCFERHLLVHSR